MPKEDQELTNRAPEALKISKSIAISKSFATISSAILILFIVLGTRMLPALGAWLVTAGSMIAFVVLLGQLINQRPLGILIGERNLMSLSRFQMVLWTIIVLSAYIVIALGRVFNKMSDPVDIEIDKHIWALMGISATALVGSPLISNTKKDKTPAASETTKAAAALVATNNTPDSLPPADKNDPAKVREVILPNSQGTLYSNPTIADASFADMFEGDEIGNTAYVDLAKVQMFFFTLIVAVSYIGALAGVLSEQQTSVTKASFPVVSEGMIALLGISNAGYLVTKGVDHTKT